MRLSYVQAEGLVSELMQRHGLLGWRFRWNRRKRGMGLCVYPKPNSNTSGRIELSRHLVERNDADVVRDTILHEIAHALAGQAAGHGPVWQSMCLRVGARPERCGKADMPLGRWRASCPSCRRLYHRHRKPKTLTGWFCRPCGREEGRLVWCA